jgi:hypothetical protein
MGHNDRNEAREERSNYEYAQRIPTPRIHPKTEKLHLWIKTIPKEILYPPERQT